MATVAYIPSTASYILTYEYCGSQNCNVWYRIATSPLEFQNAQDYAVYTSAGTRPSSSPYVVHTTNTKGQPIIIMNAMSSNDLWINNDVVNEYWTTVDVGQNAAYSRSILIMDDDGDTRIFLAGAGLFSDSNPQVTVGKVSMVAQG